MCKTISSIRIVALLFAGLLFSSFLFSQEDMRKQIHISDIMQLQHRTDSIVFNSFLWQDFPDAIFPPQSWSVQQGNTPETWKNGDISIYPPLSGNYFALCRYDETYTEGGQDEQLFSPVLDLSGLTDPMLSFYFLFSKFWGISPNDNYDLQVLVSKDGGTNFSDTIWTELDSDTASWDSWQWVKAEIDIKQYNTEHTLVLCFRYVGFDGADAAIEDIAIMFTNEIEEQKAMPLQLFPNPATDKLTLAGEDLKKVTLYDSRGKIILQQSLSGDNQTIHIEDIPVGVYTISAETRNSKRTGKIIKK